jgi:hypothetical protein
LCHECQGDGQLYLKKVVSKITLGFLKKIEGEKLHGGQKWKKSM